MPLSLIQSTNIYPQLSPNSELSANNSTVNKTDETQDGETVNRTVSRGDYCCEGKKQGIRQEY